MFRINIVSKCKTLLENVQSSSSISSAVEKFMWPLPLPVGNVQKFHSGSHGNFKNLSSKGSLPVLSSYWNAGLQIQSSNLQLQQNRFYYVMDGGIKWHRRRAKILAQRKKVLKPLSPVIDHLYPLPITNEGKYPEELFNKEHEIQNDPAKDEKDIQVVAAEINRQVAEKDHGRLFAVINIKGKQFKITSEDIIILQGYWAPNVGDRLRIHKILLIGGKDFTMIGKPLLDHNMIRIEGTVVEKTLSYTKLHFRLKKRKNFRRLKFHKEPYTMLRINMIEFLKPLANLEATTITANPIVDSTFRISATASS